jgi:hypothetical protein
MVTVRAATSADEPSWRELWAGYNAFYEATVPESVTQLTWRRILDPAAPIIGRVAERGGRVVGLSTSVLHESSRAAASAGSGGSGPRQSVAAAVLAHARQQCDRPAALRFIRTGR